MAFSIKNISLRFNLALLFFLQLISIYQLYRILQINTPVYTDYLREKNKEPTSCDDFIYGCCEIYTGCHFDNNSSIQVNTDYIDWNVIVQKSKNDADCPRVRDIITGYNVYQLEDLSVNDILKEVSSCSVDSYPINDCCSYDYNCDLRYYYDYKKYALQNDFSTIEYEEWFNTSYGFATLYTKPNSMYWDMGTCPSFQEVIHVYEDYIEEGRFDHFIYFNYSCLIFNCLFSLIIIISICKVYCCIKNDRDDSEHTALKSSA